MLCYIDSSGYFLEAVILFISLLIIASIARYTVAGPIITGNKQLDRFIHWFWD
jgi:hypothetical protein